MYYGYDCVEKFIGRTEAEAKRLYETFLEQPLILLTQVLQKEYNEATKCHIYTLFQCSGWIHPGESPSENLACKTTPVLISYVPNAFYLI